MKRFHFGLILLLIVSLCTASLAEIAIPASVMDAAISKNDAGSLIRDYLYPYLETNDTAALLYAAELNISNGNPHIRDISEGGWGERAMFGRLLTAGTVMRYVGARINLRMSNAYLADLVRTETFRLLFGPWKRDGATQFRFGYKVKGSVLDYATGKFIKNTRAIYTIRITHTTEYSGATRYAYLACDWKHKTADGDYVATFGIVR